jgi:excisionase family DNA binding protein
MSDKIKQEYFSLAEAAKILGVSVPTLYRWKYAGKIHFYKIAGTVIRVKREDIDKLIEIDDSTPEDKPEGEEAE